MEGGSTALVQILVLPSTTTSVIDPNGVHHMSDASAGVAGTAGG